MKKIRVASLFTGCGGMDLGLCGGFEFLGKKYSKNPVEIVFANDLAKSSCNIFDKNFQTPIIRADIKDIPSSDIPDHDILTAGIPCQQFSILAQNPPRIGTDSPTGMLYMQVVRIIRDKKPSCFIIENVRGIMSANNGEAFKLIILELEKQGYTVTYKLINSADFGIPQTRERVFIIGFRNDLQMLPEIKIPSIQRVPLKKALEKNGVDKKYYFSKKAVQGLARSKKRNPTLKKGRVQDVNMPCSCITAHLSKSSLNSLDPVLMDGKKYRRFTPREAARIQSFPENFVMCDSDTGQYTAIGNAVPPVLMWHVSQLILKHVKKVLKK